MPSPRGINASHRVAHQWLLTSPQHGSENGIKCKACCHIVERPIPRQATRGRGSVAAPGHTIQQPPSSTAASAVSYGHRVAGWVFRSALLCRVCMVQQTLQLLCLRRDPAPQRHSWAWMDTALRCFVQLRPPRPPPPPPLLTHCSTSEASVPPYAHAIAQRCWAPRRLSPAAAAAGGPGGPAPGSSPQL
jgi:hypothetical protein